MRPCFAKDLFEYIKHLGYSPYGLNNMIEKIHIFRIVYKFTATNHFFNEG
ncbi:hypothetical protein HMPREF1250_0780 [Megasphaera vaginalis (ex Srinivasan et al. 2021)]|uniref:Uncharacterized protein n=1 Tax=Megasphaera vaginalis (ex Srinivasan et al. 2021) TaxID=1111454 RepID=U7UJU4_9FIRM|nr:hypothetical protein HMPREF1250_0780 [Megasphaera vaginalis (ex Srinivasan et al. 2021)]